MKAYVYQAALYCPTCAERIRERLCIEAGASAQLMETGCDSYAYPQGPYGQGGGEADCPQHCDACSRFLENPLTSDGYAYAREKLAEGRGNAAVLEAWRAFYELEVA
ncbi:hypothetical protein EN780_03325 [Mesorhizobium sp. M4B.F.Ca.ET.089.01.1.1]|uniref:hypothetical protein n=1 Tax=Mesorhizobium sp. M4B.F.Ca.ET.089.01.1.1 TaxID=2496662 RepID=UPI000FE3A2BE|nr:hypothetical protein [Mesorhizobium sp. M4B.F.Ca.ET.089.01.1.1]RWX70439.1 hypothetical protein EN780_03325 [Mesorhizobium sp. M4B.F.Ca.ET.089.01.1.1]